MLVTRKVPILCKNNANDFFQIQPLKWEKEKYLLCEAPPGAENIRYEGNLICSFNIEAEKYFFQSLVNISEDGRWWRIDGMVDTFKLQRRQAYRIRIPDGYKTKCILRLPHETKNFSEGVILDISSGGCKLQIPGHSALKNGQVMNLQLLFSRREPLELIGEIRHVQKVTEPKPHENLGVMFRSVNSMLESQLFAITMELHRELAGKVVR